MMKYSFLSLLFLMLAIPIAVGQKALLIEKRGSLKTVKIFVGETIYYKLKSDKKQWLEERIIDIKIEEGYVLFENRIVHVDSIYAIQFRNARNAVKTIANVLIGFSYAWNFWTIVSLIDGTPFNWSTIAIGVGSFVVGQLLKQVLFKTYKFKGRKRIRLIDLTFYETIPAPNRT